MTDLPTIVSANPSVTVIVATYNALSSLKLCLYSLERQEFTDFEIILADDGSGPDLAAWVREYQGETLFSLRHLWQEDQGFRKCRMLNRAVMEARGDYLVFLDADCIQARDFLKTHWLHREKRYYLGGMRVMMDPSLTATITREMIDSGTFDHLSIWAAWQTLRGGLKRLEEACRPLRTLRPHHPFHLLGCNFSIHRQDLLSINGFDEDYTSRGGGEDTDVALRLDKVGMRLKSVRYAAIQYHLGHGPAESKENSFRLFQSKRARLTSPEEARAINSAFARQAAIAEGDLPPAAEDGRRCATLTVSDEDPSCPNARK
ncbi:MAG: glycosyltransferase [Magnetococcales bacterium]|nr:glycosyltransferase [Magnetococcales bacterium]